MTRDAVVTGVNTTRVVSAGGPTFPRMWNPWGELEARPHLTLRWIEAGRRGCIDFRTSTITMVRGMLRAERRSVLTHELVHDERGPVPRWLVPREEARVREEAARRLINIHDLAEALRWAYDVHEAAEALDVDVPTLQARLERCKHPSERAILATVLGDLERHP